MASHVTVVLRNASGAELRLKVDLRKNNRVCKVESKGLQFGMTDAIRLHHRAQRMNGLAVKLRLICCARACQRGMR